METSGRFHLLQRNEASVAQVNFSRAPRRGYHGKTSPPFLFALKICATCETPTTRVRKRVPGPGIAEPRDKSVTYPPPAHPRRRDGETRPCEIDWLLQFANGRPEKSCGRHLRPLFATPSPQIKSPRKLFAREGVTHATPAGIDCEKLINSLISGPPRICAVFAADAFVNRTPRS